MLVSVWVAQPLPFPAQTPVGPRLAAAALLSPGPPRWTEERLALPASGARPAWWIRLAERPEQLHLWEQEDLSQGHSATYIYF